MSYRIIYIHLHGRDNCSLDTYNVTKIFSLMPRFGPDFVSFDSHFGFNCTNVFWTISFIQTHYNSHIDIKRCPEVMFHHFPFLKAWESKREREHLLSNPLSSLSSCSIKQHLPISMHRAAVPVNSPESAVSKQPFISNLQWISRSLSDHNFQQ